jgi:hypothetical protein
MGVLVVAAHLHSGLLAVMMILFPVIPLPAAVTLRGLTVMAHGKVMPG